MKKRVLAVALIICMMLSLSYAIPGNGKSAIQELKAHGVLSAPSNQSPEAIALGYMQEKHGKGNLPMGFKIKLSDVNGQESVVRLQSTLDGIPVYGFDQVMSINAKGEITALNGHLPNAASQRAGKKLNANKAIAVALEDLQLQPVLEEAPQAELVYVVTGDEAILAYQVELSFLDPLPGRWSYFVAAGDGTILNKFNRIHTAKPGGTTTTGTTVDSSGIDVLGQLRTFKALKGTTYSLVDNTRGNGIFTYDAANRTRTPGTLWTDADNNLNAAYDKPAVSAHANAALVYDFYKLEYNRNSYDNRGAKLISTVHYGSRYNNAFWNGTQMVYGDGDGNVFKPLSGALDVVAHELTHAVTEYTCDLVYQNESGAINEALSDIIGTRVEFFANDRPDYLIGEDISGPGLGAPALRSMSDPTQMGDPDHYSKRYTGTEDNGGVHINSSIINKAAYLMAEGGNHYGVTVNGIGIKKTADIFYRCMTNYLTTSSNFSQLKSVAIMAAKDLYGATSPEVQAVTSAFNAVGIQ